MEEKKNVKIQHNILHD